MPGKATRTTSMSLRDYFEALTKAVFRSGISMGVVEARWGGLRAAFADFDPVRVARFTPETIEALMQDPRIVRNRRKIEATVDNAAAIVALDREHGGLGGYLRSHAGAEEVVEDLAHRFKVLDENGALFFLRAVGEDVPAPAAALA